MFVKIETCGAIFAKRWSQVLFFYRKRIFIEYRRKGVKE
ncbi:hypothetical protein HMPREF1153_0544 [Selenomonas sp. CM52]|nr:hypothetical protein HMPREF1153_0544 [Selenomonas sp. CM52]